MDEDFPVKIGSGEKSMLRVLSIKLGVFTVFHLFIMHEFSGTHVSTQQGINFYSLAKTWLI